MNEKIKTICLIVITLSIVVGVIFYCYVIYDKHLMNKEKQEQLKLENEGKEINLNNCLIQTEKEIKKLYQLNFKNCQTTTGLNWKCLNELGNGMDKMSKEWKDECYKNILNKLPRNNLMGNIFDFSCVLNSLIIK